MIIGRIARGITKHFPARASEWALACMMITWGVILLSPPDTFSASKSYSVLARMASESTWGWAALAVGSLRLLALVINGTFADTWYGRFSPHVRGITSFLSCGVWTLISIGFMATRESTTGLAVYPYLLLLDCYNVIRCAQDAAELDKARLYGAAEAATVFASLPFGYQLMIMVVAGVGIAVAAGKVYLKQLGKDTDPSEKKTDLIISAASITDMQPLRDVARLVSDLCLETKGVRQATEEILSHMRQSEQMRENDREVERRVQTILISKATDIANLKRN